MDLQYKPTKPKKEKPQKAPKEPKAEKPIEIGTAKKVKIDKPKKEKAPKAEKPVIDGVSKVKFDKPKKVKEPKENDTKTKNAAAIKSEKMKGFAPIFKGGKLKNPTESGQNNILTKVNPVVAISIIAALVLVVVLIFVLVIPAIKRNGQEIVDISISSTPVDVEYLIGEEANYDGLRVTVSRKNGEQFTVRARQCQITGFDSSTEGSKAIRVTYEGCEAVFYIQVKKPPAEEQNAPLAGITMDTLPNKTVYTLDEVLKLQLVTTGGAIRIEYTDGSTTRFLISNKNVQGFSAITAPGDYNLTVRYEENGTVVTCTYPITVTE